MKISEIGWFVIFVIFGIAIVFLGSSYQQKKDHEFELQKAIQETEQQKQYNTCLFKLMANGIDIATIEKQNMCRKPIGLKPSISASVQSN